MNYSHEEQVRKYWEEQNPLFDELYRHGAARYAERLADAGSAFVLFDRCVRCIDEGTPGGIHLAGSGILLKEEEAMGALERAEAGGIFSHEGCGAAKLFARRNNLDEARADEYGREWAEKLARSFGVPYKGHIALHELERPADMHIARVVYYDGTGTLGNPERAGLPKGFVISRRYTDARYAAEEAAVAVSIALGEHGFGERITADTPLVIIPVADAHNPDFSLPRLKEEIRNIEEGRGKRVVVDGFVAPEEAGT